MDIDSIRPDKKKYDGDKLDQIFSAQRALMDEYKKIAEKHYETVFGTKITISEDIWKGGEHNLNTKAGNVFLYDMLNAAMHELSEAVQTTKNWKAWKQTPVPADVNHFKEELIDALHFYVEACLLAGITAEELYSLYFKKNKVNQFRQSSNY